MDASTNPDDPLRWREKEFQKHVLALAAQHGWTHRYHTYFSDRSESGFPDLYMIRPATGQALVAELKTMRGRLSPAQEAWFEAFRAHQAVVDASAAAEPRKTPLFGVYLWRPCCWLSGDIESALR
jgi:hypothetical protein